MPVRLRFALVLACARVLLACLVLGMVAPSGSAAARVDEMGWQAAVAARSSAVEVSAASRTTSRARVQARFASRPVRRAVPCAPARTRERVVHRRIYLRHSSLLR